MHDKALSEMMRLERNPQSGLIDHPPNFSKDCSDAVAGVGFGLTNRREIWVRPGVPMRDIFQKIADKVEEIGQENRAGTRSLSLTRFGLAVTSRVAAHMHQAVTILSIAIAWTR